jgi:hypothetical protein
MNIFQNSIYANLVNIASILVTVFISLHIRHGEFISESVSCASYSDRSSATEPLARKPAYVLNLKVV